MELVNLREIQPKTSEGEGLGTACEVYWRHPWRLHQAYRSR